MNVESSILARVSSTLIEADRAIHVGEWAAANALLKRRLEEMGDRCVRPGTIDDSGQKLLLAEREDDAARAQIACAVRRRILAERIVHLREKI